MSYKFEILFSFGRCFSDYDEFEETMIEENQLDRFADDTYLIDNQEFVKKCHLRWRNRERKYARKPTLSLKERL